MDGHCLCYVHFVRFLLVGHGALEQEGEKRGSGVRRREGVWAQTNSDVAQPRAHGDGFTALTTHTPSRAQKSVYSSRTLCHLHAVLVHPLLDPPPLRPGGGMVEFGGGLGSGGQEQRGSMTRAAALHHPPLRPKLCRHHRRHDPQTVVQSKPSRPLAARIHRKHGTTP